MARKRFFNYFKNKKWLQDVTFDNKKLTLHSHFTRNIFQFESTLTPKYQVCIFFHSYKHL